MKIGKHLAIMVIATAFVFGMAFAAQAQNDQSQEAQVQAQQPQVQVQQPQQQLPRARQGRPPRHHVPYYDTYTYDDYYDMQPYHLPRLSPGQQSALQQILKDNFTATDSLRKELSSKSQQLQTLLQSQNPDKAQLSQLSREIGDLRGQMLSAHVDMRAKLEQAGIPAGPQPRGDYGYWPCPGYGCGAPGWGGHGWAGPRGHRHYGGAPCWGPGMMMGPGMMDW